MKKSKICIILAKLSANQIKEFKLFVASPYFNKRLVLAEFVNLICKFYPDFDSKKFTEGYLLKELSKKTKTKISISKLSSEAYQLMKKFIKIQSIDSIEIDLAILQFLNDNRLLNLLEKKIEQMKKSLASIKYTDEKILSAKYKLEKIAKEYYSLSNELGKGDINISHVNFALNEQFIYKYVKSSCLTKNRMRIYAHNYNFEFLDKIINQLKDHDTDKYHPAINCWLEIYKLFDVEINVANYHEAKLAFFKNIESLSQFDIELISTILKNQCNQIFKQSKDYYIERFELEKYIFENAFKNKVYILPNNILNFISLGLSETNSETTQYLHDFLESNKERIIPEYQNKEGIYELAKAHLYFAEEKHELALDFLNKVKCQNIHRKQVERRLRALIYYELNHTDSLDDHLNSFRKFLSVNKKDLTTIHLQTNRDFINTFLSLNNVIKGDKLKSKKIVEDISHLKILPHRKWFLKKLA